MKIILQQTIIIGGLLFSPAAMAAGFASHDAAAAPGRNATTCMGVNGSGSAQPKSESCDANGEDLTKPSLRGSRS